MRSRSRLAALTIAAAVVGVAGVAAAQDDGPVSSPAQVDGPTQPGERPARKAAAKKTAATRAEKKQALAAKKAKERRAAKKRRADAKKKLAAKKKKRRAGKTARASSRRRGDRRGNNMPAGWSWPPSPEMLATGKACTDELDRRSIVWKPGQAELKVANPIVVPAMEIGGIKLVSQFRKGPFVMDCALALALSTHAQALFGLGVREIGFSRIHGYTNVIVGGVQKNFLSRHALGLAIDIKWFVDAEGRKAVVLDDYPKADPLLLAIELYLASSGGFRTVLTPGNDPKSHYDHFHVETKVDYREHAR